MFAVLMMIYDTVELLQLITTIPIMKPFIITINHRNFHQEIFQRYDHGMIHFFWLDVTLLEALPNQQASPYQFFHGIITPIN